MPSQLRPCRVLLPAAAVLLSCLLAESAVGSFDSRNGQATDIIFLGDSWAEGANALLVAKCAGKTLVNRGVGGSTAAEWATGSVQADGCKGAKCTPKDAFSAEYGKGYTHAWLSVGGNDFMGTGCDKATKAGLTATIKAAIDKVLAAAPAGFQVLLTGYGVPKKSVAGCSVSDAGVLQEAIQAAAAQSPAGRVVFVDVGQAFGATAGTHSDAQWYADDIHLNTAGYNRMFELPAIQTFFQCGKASSAKPVHISKDFSCLCTNAAKPVFAGATQFQNLGTCGDLLAGLAAPGGDACAAGGCATCGAFKTGAEAETVESAKACCTAKGNTPAGTAVLCIGDSITEAPTHTTYPQQLQALLGSTYAVTNAGESGAGASAKGNLPYWKLRGEQALATQPDIAVIMLGTNDCDTGEGAEVRGSYLAGLDNIVQRLRALPTKPRVILAIPPPATASAYTNNTCMADVVEAGIRSTAAKHGLQVVDVRAGTTAAEYTQNYAEDGVHPNDAGLGAIARLVQAAVASPSLGLPTTEAPLVTAFVPPAGAGGAVSVGNPGFEAANDASWGAGLARGSSELFAPPQGRAYAAVVAGSSVSQALGTMEAGKVYTATVWARSLNAHVPDTAGEQRGQQKTHANLLAKATLALKANGKEVASATVTVSVNASGVVDANGKAVLNENDDGANVFMAGGYRMHAGNRLLYQDLSADPLDPADMWTQGVENERWGMAVGPASALNGSLVIKALGGGWTATDDYAASNGVKPTSRIEIVPLVGNAPNFAPPARSGEDFMGPIYDTVLKHVGDEQPWVFDPHYCYDNVTGKLWMTWGGHSGFVTEVDAATGLVVDPGACRPCRAPSLVQWNPLCMDIQSNDAACVCAASPCARARPRRQEKCSTAIRMVFTACAQERASSPPRPSSTRTRRACTPRSSPTSPGPAKPPCTCPPRRRRKGTKATRSRHRRTWKGWVCSSTGNTFMPAARTARWATATRSAAAGRRRRTPTHHVGPTRTRRARRAPSLARRRTGTRPRCCWAPTATTSSRATRTSGRRRTAHCSSGTTTGTNCRL